MIIGCDLISSLGIDTHGTDMTIHWDYATIPWNDTDSTKNYVFSLSQYNALFNSEINIMKRIFDARYWKMVLNTLYKAPLVFILKE